MSHVFLMIVEESWVGHNYERFAPSQYIEYGPRAWRQRLSLWAVSKKETRRAQTCVPYYQVGCVVLLVETRFELPHVDIHSVPAHVPFSIRRAELIHRGVTTLDDDIRVALLSESVEHWLRKRSADECIESGRPDCNEHAHILITAHRVHFTALLSPDAFEKK
jgi:hypothetical protein